jgi:hypothetical protein
LHGHSNQYAGGTSWRSRMQTHRRGDAAASTGRPLRATLPLCSVTVRSQIENPRAKSAVRTARARRSQTFFAVHQGCIVSVALPR